MIRTADLASEAFRRATNRQKPPLPHPTANAFDEQPWRALIEAEEPDLRDYELAAAAVYFGRQIRSLRRDIIGVSFERLGKREVLRLAVARANRAFMLIRRRSRAPTKRSSNEPNAVNLQGFAHRGLGGKVADRSSAVASSGWSEDCVASCSSTGWRSEPAALARSAVLLTSQSCAIRFRTVRTRSKLSIRSGDRMSNANANFMRLAKSASGPNPVRSAFTPPGTLAGMETVTLPESAMSQDECLPGSGRYLAGSAIHRLIADSCHPAP